MKQFNLQEYLAHPERKVVTRDGKDVRIICTDRPAEELIVALVTEDEDYPAIRTYFANGQYVRNEKCNSDLFFAPNKKEGWVNLYRVEDPKYPIECGNVYDTEQKAKKLSEGDYSYVKTVKIEWEEE